MRDVLVGQCPGPRGDPDLPLYYHPPHMSGGRLVEKLGIPRYVYRRLFIRVNVMRFHQSWWDSSVRERARENAKLILTHSRGRTIYLFGRLVSEAFGTTCDWFESEVISGVVVVKCPHPSGLNRLWNDPKCESRLREAFLRETPWLYLNWSRRERD